MMYRKWSPGKNANSRLSAESLAMKVSETVVIIVNQLVTHIFSTHIQLLESCSMYCILSPKVPKFSAGYAYVPKGAQGISQVAYKNRQATTLTATPC